MLLPEDVHPRNTLYFNGAIVLREILKRSEVSFSELYLSVRHAHKITYSMFVLSLDWLYLLELVEISDEGILNVCS